MSTSEGVTLDRPSESIARITLNRPEALNALTGEMHTALVENLGRLAVDDSVRVVILTGAGKAFCAGADLGWLESLREPTAMRNALRETYELVRVVTQMPQPVIAALPGPAVGAAASLALHCDFVIAARETTFFSDPHVPGVGLVAGDGGAHVWPRLIGHVRAKEYLLLGGRVSADEALSMGMVNRLVAAEDLETEVMSWAERLAAGPTVAIGYSKRAINAAVFGDVWPSFDAALAYEGLTFMTADHDRGLAAVRDRVKPSFNGD